jgi:hypothetical protein
MGFWKTVGSTGTVDEQSLDKVILHGPIAQLREINGGATIRYNIPIFFETLGAFGQWRLRIRSRRGTFGSTFGSTKSTVTVQVFELDMATGLNNRLARWISSSNAIIPSQNFENDSLVFPVASFKDLHKFHYVEVTLSAENPIRLPSAEETPAIAALEIQPE